MIARPNSLWKLVVTSGIIASVLPYSTAYAAAPEITQLSLRGLQIGGTTTLVIEGSALLPDPRVIVPVPIDKQSLRPGATDNRIELDVVVSPDAQPGIYQLRVATSQGVSKGVFVGIDRLEQKAFQSQIESLPVALHGRITGVQILRTSLHGKAQQRLVVDVESGRLGADLKPIVWLVDHRGTAVAWSSSRADLGGDARLVVTLPSDGEYTVEFYNELYKAPDDGRFRLKVGELHYADRAFPYAVSTGTNPGVEPVSTNLPTDIRLGLDECSSGLCSVTWPSGDWLVTGARPSVLVSTFPELVESAEGNVTEVTSTAPCGLNGRIFQVGQEDRFLVPVTPGANLRFDLVAQRIGSPLDGVLTIFSRDGSQLATNDDQPGTWDSSVTVTVPDDISKLVVVVTDKLGRGGPQFVYRITVQPNPLSDFQLRCTQPNINIPRGNRQLARIDVDRNGYDGPIKLEAVGLPEGVRLETDEVPQGVNSILAAFTADATDTQPALFSIRGRSVEQENTVMRAAQLPANPATAYQRSQRSELAVATGTLPSLTLDWKLAREDTQGLAPGGKLPARVTVSRPADDTGQVRLQLITSQVVPTKKAPDPKDKNKKLVVEDVERALRLQDTHVLADEVSDQFVDILVPIDLPHQPYDLAFRAELLSDDNETVISSNVSNVRRLQIMRALAIELTGEAEVEATAGVGETGQLRGTIQRAPGIDQPALVTAVGLPKGIVAPQITVPADHLDFQLDFRLPFGSPADLVKSVKIVAYVPANPRPGQARVKSNELSVNVSVRPGDRGTAEPPLTIFEDDRDFVGQLNAGKGKAEWEDSDSYSGIASLRVHPKQRFSDALPGLGVMIRENPGPGEYRYVRFAWKKKGGQSITLKINHDGQWGRADEQSDGPLFAYRAGQMTEGIPPALVLDEQLPEDFVVVTRDLYDDFGEFQLTGIAFAPDDGEYGLYDHIYLGRSLADFQLAAPTEKAGKNVEE